MEKFRGKWSVRFHLFQTQIMEIGAFRGPSRGTGGGRGGGGGRREKRSQWPAAPSKGSLHNLEDDKTKIGCTERRQDTTA